MAGKSSVVRRANKLLREAGSKSRVTNEHFESIFRAIYELVREGARVPVQHFGTFLLVERAPRRGWNVRKGIPAPIPARLRLMFKSRIQFAKETDQ